MTRGALAAVFRSRDLRRLVRGEEGIDDGREAAAGLLGDRLEEQLAAAADVGARIFVVVLERSGLASC